MRAPSRAAWRRPSYRHRSPPARFRFRPSPRTGHLPTRLKSSRSPGPTGRIPSRPRSTAPLGPSTPSRSSSARPASCTRARSPAVLPSPVVSAAFVIATVPEPSISPNGDLLRHAERDGHGNRADSIQISTDSATWTKYSTALALTTTTKLHARAFQRWCRLVGGVGILRPGNRSVPSITPNGGSFYGSTSVTVAAAGADSLQISTDSATWTKYSAALVLAATTKLHARAFKGGAVSSVASASFTSSTIPVPILAPNGGTFYSAPSVSITAPAGTDSVQTSRGQPRLDQVHLAVSVSSSGKLYARSFAGGVAPPVVSGAFVIASVPARSSRPTGASFRASRTSPRRRPEPTPPDLARRHHELDPLRGRAARRGESGPACAGVQGGHYPRRFCRLHRTARSGDHAQRRAFTAAKTVTITATAGTIGFAEHGGHLDSLQFESAVGGSECQDLRTHRLGRGGFRLSKPISPFLPR